MTTVHDDLIEELGFIEDHSDKSIIRYVAEYFDGGCEKLMFPAKSYAVAIIYSRLIEHYYKVSFLASLSDPELFLGTDRFFSPYSSTPQIYDQIFKNVDTSYEAIRKSQSPDVKKTVAYFLEEFGVASPE